jgi:hypothetical protein
MSRGPELLFAFAAACFILLTILNVWHDLHVWGWLS